MGQIKLLHLVASSHGGAATHIRDLVRGLPEDYHSTVAMPFNGGNVSENDFETAGATPLSVCIETGFVWKEFLHLRRILQTNNFQIFHLHGARAAFYGRLVAATLSYRPRIVFTIHGFATPFHSVFKRTVYLWLERVLQQITDRTICVAQAEADVFLSFKLTTPNKISIVPYGIDVARFSTPPPILNPLLDILDTNHGPVILTICRLNVPRDFGSLLTAFEKVLTEFPDAHLLIVGDGPQRAEVETLIHRLELNYAVHITGFRDDIPALMALADVYVLTSYGWEGYPISTLEAQAAAVSVVVTDAGGSKEAVLNEETGLVVPKCQPDALGKALMRLLQDSDLCQRLGAAGQQRASQEFSRERMVKNIEAIYGKVVL